MLPYVMLDFSLVYNDAPLVCIVIGMLDVVGRTLTHAMSHLAFILLRYRLALLCC